MKVISYRRRGIVNRRSFRYIWYVVGAVPLVVLAVTFLAPDLNWDGAILVTVRLRVTDATTGQPISNASVQVLNHVGEPFGLPVRTATNGIATLQVMVGAGGSRGLFYSTTVYGSHEPLIQVNCTGYDDAKVVPGSGRTISVLGIGTRPVLSAGASLKRAAVTQPATRTGDG